MTHQQQSVREDLDYIFLFGQRVVTVAQGSGSVTFTHENHPTLNRPRLTDDGQLTDDGELTVGYCTTRDSGIRVGPRWDRLRRLRDANVGLAITDPRVRSFLSLDPELLDLLRPECRVLLP